jgi:ATP-dependent exoDNAse (exonuclease V) beta subunit (contains helicase and exonuclease domains)
MLLRFVQARDLMELARRARSAVLQVPGLSPCPPFDFAEVYSQSNKGKGNDNMPNRRRNCASGNCVSPAIGNICAGRFVSRRQTPGFTQLWQEKFAPLRRWICAAATCVAAEVQRDYLNFRLDHGVVTYDDQIALAEELLQHPVAAQRIREESFRVILDEAQDTEPLQFSVLLEATRPPEAKGLWLQDRRLGPRPGTSAWSAISSNRFTGKRADLNYYRSCS